MSSINDPDKRDTLTYAHNLTNRFFQYALTVLHLCDDKKVETLPSFGDIKVGDLASIDILTRAEAAARAFDDILKDTTSKIIKPNGFSTNLMSGTTTGGRP